MGKQDYGIGYKYSRVVISGSITTSFRQTDKLRVGIGRAQGGMACVSRMLGIPGLLESYILPSVKQNPGKLTGIRRAEFNPWKRG